MSADVRENISVFATSNANLKGDRRIDFLGSNKEFGGPEPSELPGSGKTRFGP